MTQETKSTADDLTVPLTEIEKAELLHAVSSTMGSGGLVNLWLRRVYYELNKLKGGTMIESSKNYERYEDMSRDGKLTVYVEPDGDAIVTIYEPKDELYPDRIASAQFCTLSGGGKSPRVRDALYKLAEAIRLDNEESPQHRS